MLHKIFKLILKKRASKRFLSILMFGNNIATLNKNSNAISGALAPCQLLLLRLFITYTSKLSKRRKKIFPGLKRS